jgi:hypothetical protein
VKAFVQYFQVSFEAEGMKYDLFEHEVCAILCNERLQI